MMMMTKTEPNGAAPDDVELLLPWYASGEISDADRVKVERYLSDNPEAEFHLALMREEMDGAITLNETLGAPSAGSLDRLMGDIRAARAERRPAIRFDGLLERLSQWLSIEPPRLVQFAAIGAAIVIVVQGLVIGSMVTGPSGTQYEAASGESVTVQPGGPRLLVGFTEQATAKDIVGVLAEIGGTIVSGPVAGGLFEVGLDNKKATDEEIDALVETLKAKSAIIQFAAASD